jgi:selenocysteine-specific elongation factor
MQVVATAGHVDHGKSTLVRALTGTEPDRWAEERRRGLTIDLGYAWTTLASGQQLAFVDVPGHQRFIGNMLAGLGPAPAVMFVVAADEGWRRQSEEHLAAITALGLRHGILVVTRSDLADPAGALGQARAELAASSLGVVPAVAVSGTTGAGLEELRDLLDELASSLPVPDPTARVRLWVDRSFSMLGSGTVVTGTLGQGTVRVGDTLELRGRPVRVRGLQSFGQDRQEVTGVSRIAINLRQVPVHDVERGDTLLTPGSWTITHTVDVRLLPPVLATPPLNPGAAPGGVDPSTGRQPPVRENDVPAREPASWSREHENGWSAQLGNDWSAEVTGELMLHVGTVAVPAHVRPLGDDTARLTLPAPLPLQVGDQAILRDPGRQRIAAGALVLDADPPALRRRGAAQLRARELANASERPDLVTEVRRRGAVRLADLSALGIPNEVLKEEPGKATPASTLHRDGEWLVTQVLWDQWVQDLSAAVDARATSTPLDPGLSLEAARRASALPDIRLLTSVARDAHLALSNGQVTRPDAAPSFGAAEAGLAALEARLRESAFDAPERPDLKSWGLGSRELAAAERSGRILRLPDDVVLLPSAPALAMRVLSALPQPFTTSVARQALGTTRRVAIPLLEHLDSRGWTRRLDGNLREVRKAEKNDAGGS